MPRSIIFKTLKGATGLVEVNDDDIGLAIKEKILKHLQANGIDHKYRAFTQLGVADMRMIIAGRLLDDNQKLNNFCNQNKIDIRDVRVHLIFKIYRKYLELPVESRQYLSEATQSIRHGLSPKPTTEAYWESLTPTEQEDYIEQYAIIKGIQPATPNTHNVAATNAATLSSGTSFFNNMARSLSSAFSAMTSTLAGTNTPVKLLVLDVERTLIENWVPINGNWDDLKAVIDPSIPGLLRQYKDAGWTIVLATGTGGNNLDRYTREFAQQGLSKLISVNQPRSSDPRDGKEDKVRKYAEEYNVQNRDRNVIFIDDGDANVERVRAAGFPRSYCATKEKPLRDILREHAPVVDQPQAQPTAASSLHAARDSARTAAVTPSTSSSRASASMFVTKVPWASFTPEQKSDLSIKFKATVGPIQDKASYWDNLTLGEQQEYISSSVSSNEPSAITAIKDAIRNGFTFECSIAEIKFMIKDMPGPDDRKLTADEIETCISQVLEENQRNRFTQT